MQNNDPHLTGRRIFSIILMAGLGILLSLGLGFFVRYWYNAKQEVFQSEWVVAISSELKAEVLSATQALHNWQTIIFTTRNLTSEVFQVHSSSSFIRYPAVKSFYWAVPSAAGEANRNFSFEMSSGSHSVDVSGKRVLDIAGLDLLLEQAVRSRRLLIMPSSPFSEGNLFLAVLPIAENREGVKGQLRGVLFAEFDFSEVFSRILKQRDTLVEGIRFQDVTLPGVEKVFFDNNWEYGQGRLISQRFSVAGRIVQIDVRAKEDGTGVALWGLVVALGLCLTGLTLLLLLQKGAEVYRIEDKASLTLREINERNRLYLHYLNSAAEAFLALDVNGNVTHANAAANNLFAKKFEGCSGRHISTFLTLSSYGKLFEVCVDNGPLRPKDLLEEIIVEGVGRNGEAVPLSIQVKKIKNSEEAVWSVVCRDVSQRMKIQGRLKRSDHQFKQAFILGSVPMVLVGRDVRIQDTNKAFCDFLGYEASQLQGRALKDVFHPSCVDDFLNWFAEIKVTPQESFRCEQRLLNRAGYNLWVIASYTAVYDHNGRLENVVCQYHDFTERRYAEEELRANQEKLANLVALRTKEVEGTRESLITSINAADNAIFVFDNNDKLEFSSDLVLEFFPELKDDIYPGVTAWRIIELQSKRTGESLEEQQARLDSLHKGVAESDLHLDDGRWIQTTRRKTPSGGTVVVYTDVTIYKEQEERLLQQTVELTEALKKQQEMVEQEKMFVSVVSHEFKTPLAIIDSAAQRMLRKGDQLEIPDVQKRLGRIREAVERLLRLMNSTLTQQRIETGKMQFSPEEKKISGLVSDLCQRHQTVVKSHHIEVYSLKEDVSIWLDPALFELVLENLLSNAEKYSPPGSTINVSIENGMENLLICVEDQGRGIAKDEQAQVFNRFFRSVSVDGIKGSGVGLAIVKQVMEMHSGTVELDSEEGKGSRFTLSFPVKRDA